MSGKTRWVALASVLAWACAENGAENAGQLPSPAPAETPSGAPVVATLHTKDSELIISGGGGSVRYTLVDAAGERHENLSLDELLAYDENLYEVVKFATAKNAGRAGAPFVDARLERPVGSVVKSLTAAPAPESH
jgi:hypothetical protein